MSTGAGSNLRRTLSEWLDAYAADYLVLLGRAPRTRQEYRRDVCDCLAFLAHQRGVTQPDQLSLTAVRAYLAFRSQHDLTAASRRRTVAALRSFLYYLFLQGVLAHDLSARVLPPTRQPRVPRVLIPAECDRLRAVCASSPRDAALVGLLLGVGLRLNEVRSLRPADLDISPEDGSSPSVRVPGVAHRRRTLSLDAESAAALATYLAVRSAPPGAPVFVSRFHRPLSIRGVRLAVVAALRRAGITHASVHTMRHTYAVQQLQAGLLPADLAGRLGHASPKTIEPYVTMLAAHG